MAHEGLGGAGANFVGCEHCAKGNPQAVEIYVSPGGVVLPSLTVADSSRKIITIERRFYPDSLSQAMLITACEQRRTEYSGWTPETAKS